MSKIALFKCIRTASAWAFIVLGSISFALMLTGPANAQHPMKCPGNLGHDHEIILEHAALAALSYHKPRNDPYSINIFQHCPSKDRREQDVGNRKVAIHNLPRNVIDTAKSDLLSRYEEEGRGRIKFVEYSDAGETFYACEQYTTLSQRLAIGFRWMEFAERIGIGFGFAIVAGTIGASLGGDEEFEAIELHQRDESGTPIGDELILGFQGTDPERLKQWVSSVQKITGDSCIFDFAVEVTGTFFKRDVDFKNKRAVLAGHSLGGAVVQYITDYGRLCRTIGSRYDLSDLDAYSFNSFGMPSNTPLRKCHDRVHSIVIAGEILERFIQGTKQVGHRYRYDTDGWNVRFFHRHGIEAVQEKICGCMDGDGSFYEYTAP